MNADVARMVGLGIRTQFSSFETNGGSRFQRARGSANALNRFRPEADIVQDRWVIETRHRQKPWEVIVEPDRDTQLLIVITAYSAEP